MSVLDRTSLTKWHFEWNVVSEEYIEPKQFTHYAPPETTTAQANSVWRIFEEINETNSILAIDANVEKGVNTNFPLLFLAGSRVEINSWWCHLLNTILLQNLLISTLTWFQQVTSHISIHRVDSACVCVLCIVQFVYWLVFDLRCKNENNKCFHFDQK